MFPPRRVLAAVDFSDSSRIALNAAGRLASHCGADLLVLHALDPLLAQAAAAAGVDPVADAAAELDAFTHTAIASREPGRCLVMVGKADTLICHVAERESIDIIVIGAHGMSGMAHAIFGSTTERVLRHAPVSVFVVPFTWTAPDPLAVNLIGTGPVIAGVDLTSASAAAATVASQLARLLHTRLELHHVVTPIAAPRRWTVHAERATADAAVQARHELEGLVRGLRPDVGTTIHVETGDIATSLALAATPRGAGYRPLLVLGRHAGTSTGAAPGAIAYRVLMQSSAPVLVVLPTD